MYSGSGLSQHYDLFAGAPCTMPPNTFLGWEASFRQTRNFSSSSELTKVVQKLGALPVNHRHCGIRTIPKPQKNLQLNLEKPPQVSSHPEPPTRFWMPSTHLKLCLLFSCDHIVSYGPVESSYKCYRRCYVIGGPHIHSIYCSLLGHPENAPSVEPPPLFVNTTYLKSRTLNPSLHVRMSPYVHIYIYIPVCVYVAP